MAKILAFAGSNSSTSINLKLVKHTTSLIEGHEVQVLDLANFPFPMFSEDYEKENGFSNSLVELMSDIKNVDGLVISVNEHNGNPSAYFKNMLDWLSRIDRAFLEDKKVLLMASSPGRVGAAGSLEVINKTLPKYGAVVTSTFSFPSFNHNYNSEEGIVNDELEKSHKEALQQFLNSI